jgi:hypothetical protein
MRTSERVKAHYEIERELASRLRRCAPAERLGLYSVVYDELFRRVPDHPMLTRKADPGATVRAVGSQYRLIRRFLRPETQYLEIGPGDCTLAYAVAKEVRNVHAVDVSEVISSSESRPSNFRLYLSDGVSIPVAPGSITFAFSNQLMEHLHPDDALAQLRNVHKALAQGGTYFCITPSALSGPHDVSRSFDDVATGFHLKEYTYSELRKLFSDVGFARIRAMISIRGRSMLVPVGICELVERLVGALPARWRREVAGRLPLRLFLGVQIVGTKE